MSKFTARAIRLLDAVEHYTKNYKGWDALYVIPQVKITSAGDGRMEGVFEVTEDKCNLAKTLHGGFITSAMDFFACYSVMHHPKGTLAWTINMNASFLGQSQIGDQIKIKSEPLLMGQKRAVILCSLSKLHNDTLVAQGYFEFFLPNPPRLFIDRLPYDPRIEN